jgi:hypothetical protein
MIRTRFSEVVLSGHTLIYRTDNIITRVDLSNVLSKEECRNLFSEPTEDFLEFLDLCSIDHLYKHVSRDCGKTIIKYKDLLMEFTCNSYRGPVMFKNKDFSVIRNHYKWEHDAYVSLNNVLADIFDEWINSTSH